MKKTIGKIIGLFFTLAFLPLSIYGMVICCKYCQHYVYVPVLVFGILLDVVDAGIMTGLCLAADMEDYEPMSKKDMDEMYGL